jgi:hypothetical protein
MPFPSAWVTAYPSPFNYPCVEHCSLAKVTIPVVSGHRTFVQKAGQAKRMQVSVGDGGDVWGVDWLVVVELQAMEGMVIADFTGWLLGDNSYVTLLQHCYDTSVGGDRAHDSK